MADIIQLLPDSVANQIAAGEVIQRPASVIKEMVENSVDAGSTSIKVIVRDAGKNLVQVIDNGCGMSETDARLACERHATSKIRTAADLFAIHTLGFRGEALASVAAIAELEIQTRRKEDEVGTLVEIKGSRFIRQEPVACPAGCRITIKNLFFNVPARRKFLKANSTELKHIINEFQRIALGHPGIELFLQHEGTELYHLPPANYRQRIVHLFGRNISQQLVEINTPTSLVRITGFIARPARKSSGEQFFFINNRFMRHPYFHKAVMLAYDKILPPDVVPSYFIWFTVSPESVDVNIHPTKTEIKFENEKAVWQILMASVREALGKFNLIPSIDFNTDGKIDIPVPDMGKTPVSPELQVNPDFNPFSPAGSTRQSQWPGSGSRYGNWEELYRGFQRDKNPAGTDQAEISPAPDDGNGRIFPPAGQESHGPLLLQLKNRYILSPVKSGLMIIDQKRAHERILFEKFMRSIRSGTLITQQQLYPVNLELTPPDYLLVMELADDLSAFGFDIRNFGPNSILISGSPADAAHSDPAGMIRSLLDEYKSAGSSFKSSPREQIARNLARSSAVHYGKTLSKEEMQEIIDRLFACEMPNYSPGGEPVITILSNEEIEKKFRR
jgi:DNA mismatch repair protein MutL